MKNSTAGTPTPASPMPDGARVSRIGRPDEVRVGAVTLLYRNTNVRGWPVGAHHHAARVDDLTVALVRKRHAAGERVCDLAREVGVSRLAVCAWVHLRRRAQPAARVIVERADERRRCAIPKTPTDSDPATPGESIAPSGIR